MEGTGVTNYAVDKPSFAFSTSTTEFDDALIRRRVITKEDAIVAKGASREHAQQLLEAERQRKEANRAMNAALTRQQSSSRSDDQENDQRVAADHSDDEDGDEEDEFLDDDLLQRYREHRLEELREEQCINRREFGEVIYIARPEWTRHVNEASERVWVVVCLTSSDTERTGSTEAACQVLAKKYPRTKFVLIPSHSAIHNWPDENLPSLFLYRHGKMQHQLIQLRSDLTAGQLEEMLTELTIL